MARHSKPPVCDSLPPAPPRAEAFHGLAGEIVRTIEPHSEADPTGLLVQTLVMFGFVVGRHVYFPIEADRHYPNEYCVEVGKTSKSRKGTSWKRILNVFSRLPAWPKERVQSGLSSGEGLIWAVRDPDILDKRLLVFESEFASPLEVITRIGNTLSEVLRLGWDSGDLRILTKKVSAVASNPHIALVGHITAEELRALMNTTEIANGFANRILWVYVERSKCLPDGGTLTESVLDALASRLADAVAFARNLNGPVTWDGQARNRWHEVYPELSEGKLGLLGAATSRAEAHVVRLALNYALLDRSNVIRLDHLNAALAIWDFCEASAGYAFGDALGNPTADEILKLLRRSVDGVTRTGISDHFKHHRTREQIDEALGLLDQNSRARKVTQPTGGHPVERWFAVAYKGESSEESEGTALKGPGANLLRFGDDEDLEFEPFDE